MGGSVPDLHQHVEISDAVIARELEGEMVLLNLETGMYFGLDPVGTRIWQTLSDVPTAGDVVGVLLKEYEIDRPTLEQDVLRLIGRLHTKGLVKIASEPA